MNSVLREEKKFLLRADEAASLERRLGQVLAPDPHNGSRGYMIRSLYFDTLYDGDYFDKLAGTETRRKIRLRCYDPLSDFAMLEIKQKQGSNQLKRSLRLTRPDAQRLTRGDYSPLLGYSEPFAAECYGLMHRLCYLPKTIVEYNRKAFIAKENRIRITLDSDIRSTESSFALFDPELNMIPVLSAQNTVLEVKYNGFLLDYIRRLINPVDRAEISVSKYVLARRDGYLTRLL